MTAVSALMLLCVTIIMALSPSDAYSVQQSNNPRRSETGEISRRSAFLAALAVPSIANALDMDAFVQQQLTTSEPKAEMSADEAFCRFGQPSPETGAACLRAGMPTTRKSGVDVFGKVGRGDYVKCKAKWVDGHNGKLEKEWNCQ